MNELALFAGAGGGILGGKLLGWRTVCAVEWDGYARDVLVARQNDGCLEAFPIWDDIQTFDGKPWQGIVDVVSGGFPCQDISAAGKGAGIEGERSGMWKHMARIIGEVRPRYAFVENSPMLVGRGLSTVLADLAKMGYDAEWGIVGAHHVSAPHRRDRIWIFAHSKVGGCCGQSREQCKIKERKIGSRKRAKLLRFAGDDRGKKHVADSAGAQDHAKRGDCECGRHGMGRTEQAAQQDHRAPDHHGPCGCACNMANTDLSQRKRMRCPIGSEQEYADPMPLSAWWGQDPADTPKSEVGRVAHGVAARVDRLRCIGNGQVPAVAALAWNLLR